MIVMLFAGQDLYSVQLFSYQQVDYTESTIWLITLLPGYNLPRFWEISYIYRDSSRFADIVQTDLRRNYYYVQVTSLLEYQL